MSLTNDFDSALLSLFAYYDFEPGDMIGARSLNPNASAKVRSFMASKRLPNYYYDYLAANFRIIEQHDGDRHTNGFAAIAFEKIEGVRAECQSKY